MPAPKGNIKKRNKSQSSKSSRPTKKRQTEDANHHAPSAAPAKRGKPQKVRNKGSSRNAVELVDVEERELSAEDFETFDDYKHFHGFLQNLDPQALASKVQKDARKTVRQEPIVQRKIAQAPTPSDTESSLDSADDNSLSDLESVSTASDASFDEDMDDVVSEDGTEAGSSDGGEDDGSVAAEIDYEAQGRSFSTSQGTEQYNRLPIKLSDGRVTQNPARAPIAPSKNVETAAEKDSASRKVAERAPIPVQVSEEIKRPQISTAQSLVQTQEKIAQVALDIIEDPEENIGKLARLKELQKEGSLQERRLAILTLSAVYKDIIPGYRVRPLTELEKAEKVTKEVRRLRDFEQTLVSQYRDFVNSLVSLTKTSRKTVTITPDEAALKKTAVSAACSLLRAVPHFNFRTELFNILAGQVCRKKLDDLFQMSRETIEEIFREDEEGEASFEGMRLLCKKMKDREYQVDESTVSTFLHLRLLTDMEARGSTQRVDREKLKKKDRQFRTKKCMSSLRVILFCSGKKVTDFWQ